MKRLIALSGITAALLAIAPAASAQSSPPALPALTPQQSSEVEQRLDPYRRQTEDRVARGDITADEADRLLRWRGWQIARQVARGPSSAPPSAAYDQVPPDYYQSRPRDYVVAPPAYDAPDYAPYYRYAAPYYWGPSPYFWGPAVCAGGFGRHFGGRICF
jgi:hypothetical protein